MTATKDAIIEMLQRINGANGITRTYVEILALAEDLWRGIQREIERIEKK